MIKNIISSSMIKIALSLFTMLAGCIGANDRKTKPQESDIKQAGISMTTPENKKSFYDFTMKSIDGKDINLSQYKGKKVLVINVASQCGYTKQYADLQKFHEQYGEKIVLLGFPANNFGGQEPGSNDEIATFCQKNFGVTFQLFEKISVAGDDQHQLYKWLSTKSENGWNDQAPKWNFCKYLIDEKGELLQYFGSSVKPFDQDIIKYVQ
jgi:glutathione peroxidase